MTSRPAPLMETGAERRREDYGHILVVDDDAELRLLVARFLERYGFVVTGAGDGGQARKALERTAFDLVILDMMLPHVTGLEICRDIRAASAVPIIMLTARTEDQTRIASLEGGADDYITKPFNPRELLARLRSLLRRARLAGTRPAAPQPHVARFAGWTLDLTRRELTSPQGALIDLSTGEFDLLVAFVEHANTVLSRDALMELAKTRVSDAFDRSIDVQISRLRKKLDSEGEAGQIIKTVRGAGYVLAVPVAFLSGS